MTIQNRASPGLTRLFWFALATFVAMLILFLGCSIFDPSPYSTIPPTSIESSPPGRTGQLSYYIDNSAGLSCKHGFGMSMETAIQASPSMVTIECPTPSRSPGGLIAEVAGISLLPLATAVIYIAAWIRATKNQRTRKPNMRWFKIATLVLAVVLVLSSFMSTHRETFVIDDGAWVLETGIAQWARNVQLGLFSIGLGGLLAPACGWLESWIDRTTQAESASVRA